MNHEEWMVDTKTAIKLDDVNLMREALVDLGVQLEILKKIADDLVKQRDAALARPCACERHEECARLLMQCRNQATNILVLSKRLRDAGLPDGIGGCDKPALGQAV